MKRVIFLASLIVAASLSIFGQNANPTAEDYFKKGVAFLRQERFADALDAFEMSERLKPNRAETSANIGAAYMGLKKASDAIKAFQKAIDIRPAEATFRNAICKSYAAQKEFDKAIAACQEGIRLAPDSAEAAATLLDVMKFAKIPTEQLRQQIDLALLKFRDSVGVLEVAANYYQIAGDLAYAAELFERITQLLPVNSFYFARLAEVYLRLERDEQAVANARKALTLEPSNPFANFLMGKLFLELGLHEEASASFSKVLLTDPEFPEARFYFAISEKHRGRHQSALKAFSLIANRTPDNFTYQFELGGLLSDLGRYEDAIAPLQKAVALEPTNFQALYALGSTLCEAARLAEAIEVLEKANRIYPGDEFILRYLGAARARQQSLPTLDSLIAEAKNYPQDWQRKVRIIQLLSFARRLNEIESYVQEVWKLAPRDLKAYTTIALSYGLAGKRDKELDAYKRGLLIEENAGIYLGLASIYKDEGEMEKASAAYAKMIEIQPDSPMTMKLFGDHLQNMGKRREALDMYKRSLALKPLFVPTLSNAAILSARLSDMTLARQYLADLRVVDPVTAKKVERCLRLRLWN